MSTFTQDDFDKLVKEGAIDPDELPEITDGPPEITDDDVVKAAEASRVKEEESESTILDGDDVPEELRGKDISGVLDVYKALKSVSTNLAQQLNTPAPAPAQQPPRQEPPKPPQITTDDLVENDAAGLNQKLEQFFEAKAAPLKNQYTQAAALQNRSLALQQSPILKKYENTLNQVIQQQGLSNEALANPQTWVILESLVGRTHWQEIVAEQAAALNKPEPEPSAGVRAEAEQAANPSAGLTPLEKQIAAGLGVKPELYAKMKPLTNQG